MIRASARVTPPARSARPPPAAAPRCCAGRSAGRSPGSGPRPAPARGWAARAPGHPATLTGEVSARSFHRRCTSSSSGGNPRRLGAASMSTRRHRPSSVSRQRAITAWAAVTWAAVIALACLSRSLTSPPIWSAAAANRSLLACQAWASSTVSDATMIWSRSGTVTGTRSNSAVRSASSIAAVIQRVGVDREHADGSRRRARHGEPGLEQRHAGRDARDIAGHRADGVQAGASGQTPVERDPAPGGLQAGDAAAGGGDADGPAGVRSVGDVGLARGDRRPRPARRAAGHPAAGRAG